MLSHFLSLFNFVYSFTKMGKKSVYSSIIIWTSDFSHCITDVSLDEREKTRLHKNKKLKRIIPVHWFYGFPQWMKAWSMRAVATQNAVYIRCNKNSIRNQNGRVSTTCKTQPLWDSQSRHLENNNLVKRKKEADCQESGRNWQEN